MDTGVLTLWAGRSLPIKEQLAFVDRQAVEAAFEVALARLNDHGKSDAQGSESASIMVGSRAAAGDVAEIAPVALEVPDPRSSFAKRRRSRNKEHLQFVARQPCLVCGRTPCDAHHVKIAEGPMLGRKVSDAFTVPLCRMHHRELHGCGNERGWWAEQKLDPLPVAAALWQQSRSAGAADAPNASAAPGIAAGLSPPQQGLARGPQA